MYNWSNDDFNKMIILKATSFFNVHVKLIRNERGIEFVIGSTNSWFS